MEVKCNAISAIISKIQISVHDTGIGIPAEVQSSLFQKFQQLDGTTTRKYGGTGLGLAISQELINMMGGNIRLESQPDQGSTFYFEIPLRVNPSIETIPLPTAKLEGLRVLVVDQHQISRFVTTELCRRWGMLAEESATAEDALQMVSTAKDSTPYRLIFMDHSLGSNGADITHKLRETGHGRAPAIILKTATDEAKEVGRIRSASFDACLVKPIREAVLLDTIHIVLGNRNAGIVPPVPTAKEIPRFEGKRILLVEDNMVNQKVGVAMLTKLGCRVDVAANGRDALVMTARLPYDLIFMDCQMPELDGYQATSEIRIREGDLRRTPIVALTAGAMAEDREKCFNAGMDDYLSKPVRSEQLLEKLKVFLK